VRANDIGIEIEAGQAFGTGHHGTTAGCLMAIDRLANQRAVRNVLDLGTGSGVLAIGAAKRTKARVVASDIDPIAVQVAEENVRLNGEASRIRTVVAAGMDSTTISRFAPYDLIVANILAGPLVTLAPALRRHIAPGGTIILSGLLSSQQRRVAAAYRAQGLRFISADVLEDWVTLVVRR
jgi:ribosomal protein L11 methyltransferase